MEHNFHDEENNIKNYEGTDAIFKLREIAESARICMFTTYTETRPMPSRPMALQGVDEQNGLLYFFSATHSDKNNEIKSDDEVQLFFENNSKSEYLSVYGFAKISQDRVKIKELWTPWAKTWFQDGPEDPKLSLITVKPESVEYWDTKNSKMVSLLKIAVSMVSGKTFDDGVEGKLRVK